MIQSTSGHKVEIGDKVKMNIKVIGEGDLDGVEITASGFDYWRYMNEHPDEVYTVVSLDLSGGEDCIYVLDGAMGGNTWAADELIHVPDPESNFEIIKNMSLDEMAAGLFPLLFDIIEDGVPSSEIMKEWLKAKPIKD